MQNKALSEFSDIDLLQSTQCFNISPLLYLDSCEAAKKQPNDYWCIINTYLHAPIHSSIQRGYKSINVEESQMTDTKKPAQRA
ncbi:hypothetical protein, partial [Vibrio parahaemolyticus]|uniref:hypothetical protein n=1 Tax=Vibrio parahaemolyticus TaxID=670 RepID=UPI001E36E224